MSSTVTVRHASVLKLVPVVSGALLLSACGGAGGGVSSPGDRVVTAPVPPPPPAPPPPPTPPPPAPARSAEYLASKPVVGAKAGAAFDRDVTGKGVTIAVIDTGIDLKGSEFAGRISPDSKSFDSRIARCATCAPETVSFRLQDIDGHGTEVSSIALAARDGAGILGVAPGATLLALKISGPDLENVTATSPIRESGQANIANLAPAIRYGVEKGAFALSFSLNGSASRLFTADLRDAMSQVRANDRLLIESVSNAVENDDSAPGRLARDLLGADLADKEWFLFGIRVDENLRPPSLNGSPGALADRTLAVVASNVGAIGKDGELVTVTGNSFAAPAIAGAAALLKQYWPQLGGKAISRILLDTATDLGAPGVDTVFGAGLLNIERALQPQATSQSLRAASTVLDRWSSLSLSPAFGGAAGGQALSLAVSSMTVLDNFARDYAMASQRRVGGRSSSLLASGMMAPEPERWTVGPMNAALALTGSSYQDSRVAERDARRPVSFSVSPAAGQRLTISANSAVGAGQAEMFGSTLRTVAMPLTGTSAAWEADGWTAGFSFGQARRQTTGTAASVGTTYTTGEVTTPWGLGLRVAELGEAGRMLGAFAGPEFGLRGARTRLTSVTAARRLLGVDVTAEATTGRTTPTGSSELLRFTAPITSTAFSLRARKPLFGGQMQLGLASPLRVQSARASVLVPTVYDLATGVLTSERRLIDLAPAARELDLELGWWAALSDSAALRLGVAHAFDAGHVAGASDTAGFLSLTIR